MTISRSLLKPARLIHLYLGVFISPALLFFAITGALQTFSLHETHRGSDYKPPAWIAKLGQLHKKQTLVLPERRPPQASPAGKPADTAPPRGNVTPAAATEPLAKAKNLLPMKIFFLLVSVGLVLSTLTGIFMSYRYSRNKIAITALLFAGLAVPLLLLLI
jgi:hypothetical protein